jgi:TRAP-type C4-dicarboxylate transport system substrate-binding protein
LKALVRALLVLVVLSSLEGLAAPTVLKVGSLAPRESPWGQILRVWMKAVKERTHGEVELELFWNATQGDEPAQMSKLKTGQLDGAVVSAVGLGMVDPNVNVLQIPGLYASWAQLDLVRDALKPRFDRTFQAAGYELLGWGDVGLDHLMSKGFPVRTPQDLKGKRPWVWREDPVLYPFFQAAGVVPVPTSVPEAVTELSTGNVNIMSVAALVAEQLQWSPRLDHLNLMVMAPNIGGVVFSRARLDALKPDQRAAVLETGKVACRALTDRIRKEDAAALERLKSRMTVVENDAAAQEAWRKLFLETRVRLAKGTFPPELVKEVEALLR